MSHIVARLKQLRHADHAAAAAVRAVLVTSLYASPKSLIIGAITSSVIAAVVACASADRWLAWCAGLIAVIAIVRIVVVLRPDVDSGKGEIGLAGTGRWEGYYRIGAWSYSALLGTFGLLTLVRCDDGVLQLLSVTTAIGYAAGIAGRNAGRPLIALSQLCFASLPLTAGLFLSFEPLKAVLGVVILLFVVAMMEITLQTYDVILRATVATADKTALAERNAELARRDDLTGVANRTAFREQLEQRLGALTTSGESLSIHWLDLDRFKEVNDSFGHLAGNHLLAGIAARLHAAFAPSGMVARLGGDEFVVVNRIGDDRDPEEVGRLILDLVARPVEFETMQLRVSASVGVAIAPADGDVADVLLKNADLALYRAKESGRNALCFYEPAMDEKIERQRHLASELRTALERGEFTLMFQPIFHLPSQRVLSCEALLRWNNPTHGEISPVEFIPIAEEIGLIVEIGGWVLREACRAASQWPTEVRVAVNLSPIQLRSPNLPNVIVNALASSGLAPERLELEVTESVLLDDIDVSLAALQAINRMNVRTTLDDFGTGYSSLSYLTKFPFQTLKIDRSFIADLEHSPASMAIVQTVVDLATTLGMQTVAEGIETPNQYEQLRRTRCTAAQGFLLGRPMSAAIIPTMLADSGRKASTTG